MRTFTCAGVSKRKGQWTLRATNREADVYQGILVKEGDEGVKIVKLKEPMTKIDAIKYIKGLAAFRDPEVQEFLKGELSEDKSKAAPTEAAAKTEAPAKAEKPDKPKGKGAGGKGKGKASEPKTEKAETVDAVADGEVPTAEAEADAINAAAELGMTEPAFAKHLTGEEA